MRSSNGNAGMFIIFISLDLGRPTFLEANDSLLKNVILLHEDIMQTKRLVKPSVTKIQRQNYLNMSVRESCPGHCPA